MPTMSNLAPDTLGPTICIGEILCEIVATTTGNGFTEPQPLIGPFPSGAPAIFIDQCGRIGGSAALVGAVGNDDFGRVNTDRLKRDGVDVSGVLVDQTLPTGTAFVRYRDDGSRDFVFNMWTSAAGMVSWTPEIEAVVERAGHLHVIGTLIVQDNMWEIIDRAAAIIKERNGTVSFDPNIRKELRDSVTSAERFSSILAKSDLLLPSDDELFVAAGLPTDASETDAIEKLLEHGIPEITVKRGSDGSSCITSEGRRVDAPAFIVEEIDPTGAGDCFGGAYVACRRLGMGLEASLDYANAAGARNVTYRGPMEGAGTRAELDDFIANTPRTV